MEQGTGPAGGGVQRAAMLADQSHALDAEGRTEDAFTAAEDAVRSLSADFLADPETYADAMRDLVAAYVGLSGRSRRAADADLLAPIAAALGRVSTDPDGDDRW